MTEHERIMALALALKPFADAVYNDNGEVTITTPTTHDYIRAKRILEETMGAMPTDKRPANCRFRLQDEGKAYPKSACNSCGKTIMTGLGKECALVSPEVGVYPATLEEREADQRERAESLLRPGWLAAALIEIDKEVAAWPAGIRESFESLKKKTVGAIMGHDPKLDDDPNLYPDRQGTWKKVVAAAVQINGATVSMPPPASHVHILSALRAAGVKDADYPRVCEQGFLLENGIFVNRWNARRHAIGSGQITKTKFGNDLYSEDLW